MAHQPPFPSRPYAPAPPLPPSLFAVIFVDAMMINVAAVQETLNNNVLDWYRLTNNSWIVAAHSNAATVYNAMQPHMPNGSSAIVYRLDVNDYAGWMPDKFIEWMRRYA